MLGDAYELMEKYVSADWNTKREILAAFLNLRRLMKKHFHFFAVLTVLMM